MSHKEQIRAHHLRADRTQNVPYLEESITASACLDISVLHHPAGPNALPIPIVLDTLHVSMKNVMTRV